MHSSIDQHYNDESWGFSDFHVSVLNENKDCGAAYPTLGAHCFECTEGELHDEECVIDESFTEGTEWAQGNW